MKPTIKTLSFLLFAAVSGWLLLANPTPAQAAGPASGAVLCLPGVYTYATEDCLNAGPAAYQTRLGEQGISLPLRPLPATPADPALAFVPFRYALLKEQTGYLYASLQDALSNTGPIGSIEGGQGIKFISYIDTYDEDNNGKPDAFLLRSGVWMSRQDVASRYGATPGFQGLVFSQTPTQQFGWVNAINAEVPTRTAPGYQAAETGRSLPRYGVVQVFATANANNMDWYMVGPDEWVEGRFVGRVLPNPTPPPGVTGSRWIDINLYEQTLAVYENNQMVFATLIATGIDPYFTRPGTFPIYKKLASTTMQGAFSGDRSDFYYVEDVPWTMYYDDARALHAAYWRAGFGYEQSHGCVNLSPGDAQWLFLWAQEGDWVHVWDPSGATPTDPNQYTDGGA